MKTLKFLFVLGTFVISIGLVLELRISLAASAPLEVGGTVRDTANNGLANVRIRAVRNGTRVGEAQSESNGSYTVKVDGSGAFDLVYDRSDLQAHVLVQLSGQRIDKIMLRKGETYGQSEIAAQFAETYKRSINLP